VTFAFVIAAPDWSVTWPRMFPVVDCANSIEDPKMHSSVNSKTSILRLILSVPPGVLAVQTSVLRK
jgi:hypothetical protein